MSWAFGLTRTPREPLNALRVEVLFSPAPPSPTPTAAPSLLSKHCSQHQHSRSRLEPAIGAHRLQHRSHTQPLVVHKARAPRALLSTVRLLALGEGPRQLGTRCPATSCAQRGTRPGVTEPAIRSAMGRVSDLRGCPCSHGGRFLRGPNSAPQTQEQIRAKLLI